ncbi:MAG: radical SAM protein [Methanotrichaceae archaeon]|jgi:MoaA/NifB/PqqE/SkfB family radical SAM enzyme
MTEIDNMDEDEKMSYICKEAFNEVCILANGDVVCSSVDVFGRNVLGNVYQNHIDEIFNGKKYNNLRECILKSKPTAYCPILKFNCCHKNLPNQKKEMIPKIEIIMIDTTSHCNLRCPPCPERIWSEVHEMIGYHPRIAKLHDDKIREIFFDTTDTLRKIRLFNYGEPFSDKRLLNILRFVKNVNPGVQIETATNGTIMPEGWAEIIVREGLIDDILFGIDGSSQETYSKYRIGGSFDIAFKIMTDLAKFNVYIKNQNRKCFGNTYFLNGMILTLN